MNYAMVKQLILKDWYLHRFPTLLSIAGGVIAMAIVVKGGYAGFILGTILLVTVLVTISAMLAMNLTVLERREQTLAFIMSLPVSYREYTAAKLASVTLIFLVPWLAFMVASIALLQFLPAMPHGLIPFVILTGVEIFMNCCIIAAVGLVTESQGWTIAALMVGNLALNGIGYVVAHIPAIGNGMFGSVPHWSATASALLAAELAAISLVLAGTFYFQSQKKDFL
jgi:ABC-2 type transport system permease protein